MPRARCVDVAGSADGVHGDGTAVLNGPLRTFVVVPQTLIAQALHAFLDKYDRICMVGNARVLELEDMRRARPDLIIYGLDSITHDIAAAVAIARSVVPGVRFCVLSSYANAEMMQRSLAAGADGFIVTDVSPRELDTAFRLLASGLPYVDPRLDAGAGAGSRRTAVADDAQPAIRDLTPREMMILKLIVRGLSNKEISVELNIVEKTVKNHIGRIFSKLGVTTRTQAAIRAIKAGFG